MYALFEPLRVYWKEWNLAINQCEVPDGRNEDGVYWLGEEDVNTKTGQEDEQLVKLRKSN